MRWAVYVARVEDEIPYEILVLKTEENGQNLGDTVKYRRIILNGIFNK